MSDTQLTFHKSKREKTKFGKFPLLEGKNRAEADFIRND